MRLRKNVKHLSPGEKAAYVNAVLTLKTKPSVMHPADPGFSRYDDNAAPCVCASEARSQGTHGRPSPVSRGSQPVRTSAPSPPCW